MNGGVLTVAVTKLLDDGSTSCSWPSVCSSISVRASRTASSVSLFNLLHLPCFLLFPKNESRKRACFSTVGKRNRFVARKDASQIIYPRNQIRRTIEKKRERGKKHFFSSMVRTRKRTYGSSYACYYAISLVAWLSPLKKQLPSSSSFLLHGFGRGNETRSSSRNETHSLIIHIFTLT